MEVSQEVAVSLHFWAGPQDGSQVLWRMGDLTVLDEMGP